MCEEAGGRCEAMAGETLEVNVHVAAVSALGWTVAYLLVICPARNFLVVLSYQRESIFGKNTGICL